MRLARPERTNGNCKAGVRARECEWIFHEKMADEAISISRHHVAHILVDEDLYGVWV